MGHCSLFHFQGGFRVGVGSRLRITIEVELRIAKQCKCHYCKSYRGKVMEDGEKKNVFASFF